jgi:hypothetical protein
MNRLFLSVLLAFSALRADYNYKATLTYEVDTKTGKTRLCIDGRTMTCMCCKREAMFVIFNGDRIQSFCDIHSLFVEIGDMDYSCCGCDSPGATVYGECCNG